MVWLIVAALSVFAESGAFASGNSMAVAPIRGTFGSATAAAPAPSTSEASALNATQPVSVSYVQLTKCFPELKNEAWTRKVDLNDLKDEIDRRFLTTQSLLRLREVILQSPQTPTQKRLRLAAKSSTVKGHEKIDYLLTLEKLDSKGGGTTIDLPPSHRVNPQQKDLNTYLANEEITRDETSYFDTKLKGVTLSYKKNFKEISEIELKDPKGSRRVLCEDQKDLGVVCTCFSK